MFSHVAGVVSEICSESELVENREFFIAIAPVERDSRRHFATMFVPRKQELRRYRHIMYILWIYDRYVLAYRPCKLRSL